MKNNVAFFPNYKVVNSLRGLKSNEIYQTSKYSLFTALVGNRGEKLGFEEKRVRELIEKIKEEVYKHHLSVIIVNKSGIGIDGMNRIEALRRTKNPVIFRVVLEPEFNDSNSNLLNIVAIFNNSNPTWTANQQFRAALEVNNPLAHLLENLRAAVVAQSVKLRTNDISPNQMMTLVERNKLKTHSRKRNLIEYSNAEYLKYAQSAEFEAEFRFVCKVIEYFKDSAHDACRILEQLLYLMWDDSKFNRNAFYYNLVKKGFVINITDSRKKGMLIREKIVELSLMKAPAKIKNA